MISDFLTVGILELLAVISPGPDFAMLVKNTLGYSRRTGIFTAAGIASGVIFHMTYCLLGLALIISQSLLLFRIVKYIGASYLIYIGVKSLLSRDNNTIDQIKHAPRPLSDFQAYRQGLLCNMLNPKATLFFLGLFTLVISPQTPMLIQLGYGIEIILITFAWFLSLALLLTHPVVKNKLGAFQQIISKIIGVLLIAFGAELAFFERHS